MLFTAYYCGCYFPAIHIIANFSLLQFIFYEDVDLVYIVAVVNFLQFIFVLMFTVFNVYLLRTNSDVIFCVSKRCV